MKNKLIACFLFTCGVVFSQTRVSTLSQLRSAVQNNNQQIIMQAGNYNIEDLASNSRFFPCSGSNNTIDLTGVYIEFPVGSSSDAHFTITGSDNTLIGGTFENTYYNGMTEVTDYVAYNNDRDLARGGDPHIVIQGDKNTVIGTKMFIRGSFPYGYGSIYGINADNQFGLSKRGGIAVQGTNAVIDGCELQMEAFGHAIYIQSPSNHTIVRNTKVIGDVRSGAELLAETASTSLPSRSDFQDFSEDHLNPDPILPETVYSLCEDGIRLYNGGGSMLVENCIVEKMRGGIRGYLGSGATVIDSRSIDCESTNFNLPSGGEIINSVGNFAYSPISDNRLGRSNTEMELTILASPHASGSHNIADVIGNNQNIVFHRAGGPDDSGERRAIVVTGDNSTIVNETEYTIILESSASGNDITSCGPVIDNGSGNDVNSSNNCDFDTTATPTTPVTGSSFTPDPNRTYYIDVPEHNLRLAATGETEDAYTTSTTTTGANVEWQFVDKGNGSWHVQLAADVSKPRLRTRNNGGETDMQATSSDGTWTYWDFTTGSSSNTYFFTLPDGPGDQTRLQVDREGDINMVTPSHDGTWESFRITPAGFVSANGTVVQITKRNATGFAFDGGNGGENGQNLYLWGANQNNVNQQWIEIDRGNGYYSYQKMGTEFCIDGNGGGEAGQNVYLWTCSDNNQNQHWKKVATAGGSFRLEKRNSPGYSLDGNRGGENGQNVYLWNSDSNNQNQQWLITPVGSAKSVAAIVATDDVIVYPNPVVSTTTINGAANSTVSIYDMNGALVLSKNIVSDSEQLDLSSLSTGIYYGQAVGASSISVIKIVKK